VNQFWARSSFTELLLNPAARSAFHEICFKPIFICFLKPGGTCAHVLGNKQITQITNIQHIPSPGRFRKSAFPRWVPGRVIMEEGAVRIQANPYNKTYIYKYNIIIYTHSVYVCTSILESQQIYLVWNDCNIWEFRLCVCVVRISEYTTNRWVE